ncbi:16S rRNA (cytosine967-C5)-methyltransferase [Limimonas halophila]|uniref:16S rRNA (Cytosine967-C5)-methyltransferase n=1 Tax=Limimonas halophila TaxID=1082479 RepID=A0A1G7MC85_9PROT|nr:RsmB/NOP family class I SAM-dependent RNA methyltransferase [Limimonas halophila]SDF59397.1 16S rRNA (cytosine967-C5)-methyltransferase [Limimonas halophila]
MTPAARIAAVIELLGQIEALQRPADTVVQEYTRARRFMGSKDRRAVMDRVFAALRARARLNWWVARAGGESRDEAERRAETAAAGPRHLVLAALVLIDGMAPEDVAGLCDGGQYHPGSLEPDERALVDALAGQPLTHAEQPLWVRVEVPAWLIPSFERVFGDHLERELAALNQEAPVDLRVNPLIEPSREAVTAALAEHGMDAAPTPYAPNGVRLAGRRAVTNSAPFRDGQVEVQDEASQIAAALVGAAPDMAVCDICAGAGGKTLALAGDMDDRGRLVALDIDAERLGRAGPRLARAGAHTVERRVLADERDPWLDANAEAFDRVLVDAPCSGVGAWRRQPDARWKLTQKALANHTDLQDLILDQAAPLVRPGGRLVYATCSLLPEENGDRVAAFRERHPGFVPLPVEHVWAETIGGACPGSGPDLTLTPARTGTDGFYIAVLERREAA